MRRGYSSPSQLWEYFFYNMTLHYFLKSSGLNLSNNHESGLGDKIANRFRAINHYTPIKITVGGNDVIDYPDGFLESCEELIIQFVQSKMKTNNG